MEALVIKKHSYSIGATLFGGVFALAGFFSVYAYFFMEITGDRWVALLVGAIFSIVGLSIVGFIEYVRCDRQSGTITRLWGIFFPFVRKVYPLHEYNEVHTTRETRTRNTKHGSTTYQVYPVRLKGGDKTLDIVEPKDKHRSRVSAEDIARYLQFPLVREIDGEVTRREANELDMSLAERRRKNGDYTTMPAAPVDSAIKMKNEAGIILFELPADRSGLLMGILSVIFGLPFYAFVAWFFFGFSEQESFGGFEYAFLIIFLVPIVSIAIKQFAKGFTRLSLELSPTGLVLKRKFLVTRSMKMPRDELEELLKKGNKIVAISDKQTLVIPVVSRHHEDIEFLYNMILYRLGR